MTKQAEKHEMTDLDFDELDFSNPEATLEAMGMDPDTSPLADEDDL